MRTARQNPPTLSIVVAAYNEEDVLHLFFARLQAVLEDLGESYEIVCVNDGSRDRTAEILNAALDEAYAAGRLGTNVRGSGLDLDVTEATVMTHVSNLLSKLSLKSRTQAALYALREGLVGRES